MPQDEDNISFTVRLPRDLGNQITQRASVARRSRNQEIITLLETAISKAVEADLATIGAP